MEVSGPEEEQKIDSDVEVRWLHRGGRPVGEALVEAVSGFDFPEGRVHAFVHGEAHVVKILRRLFRVERAVPREDLSISGYWRLGHNEDGWQASKRDWNARIEAEQEPTPVRLTTTASGGVLGRTQDPAGSRAAAAGIPPLPLPPRSRGQSCRRAMGVPPARAKPRVGRVGATAPRERRAGRPTPPSPHTGPPHNPPPRAGAAPRKRAARPTPVHPHPRTLARCETQTPRPAPPLPQRDGVDPVRVRLPAGGQGATVREHLVQRLSTTPGTVDRMFAEGQIVGADGHPVPPGTPYEPGLHLWFHRELPEEAPVPFPLEIVHRDDHILVVDKPHFLATTPAAATSPRPPSPACATSWASRNSAPHTASTASPPAWCCSSSGPKSAAPTRPCSATAWCARSTRPSPRTTRPSPSRAPCAAGS
ncbi:hypothetical protein SHKM778_64620 [Streptomyces sp. KM77-8]|uniref:SIP-like Rossmann fold domain-containing protein n=1 Tax=Streptomyces haneummycinicus TaxID=3074435 RepID=A0AAT9HRQ6_9ACTN